MVTRIVAVTLVLPVLLFTKSAWTGTSVLIEELLFMAGILLVGAGAIGRVWCLVYIGGRKNKDLVTLGPYSLTRNPLYFFSFLGLAGFGLCTESITTALILCGSFLAAYRPVIASEECRLSELFGARFAAYKARTPRFWPHPAGYDLGEVAIELRVPPFVAGLREVVWFVAGIGLFSMLDRLHHEEMLPAILRLY